MIKSPLGNHLAPCIIPYTEDYEIDEPALRKHIKYLANVPGMDGVVMNPHAGEVYSQTGAERLHILEIAVDELKGKAKVIAGVAPSPDTTKVAVEMAQEYQRAGADGLLLMAPHWFAFGVNTMPQVGVDYVQQVADAIDIPIMLYELGSWTGAHYTLETLAKICEDDRIVAVKVVTMGHRDATEFEEISKVLHGLSHPVAVLTGNDNVLLYNFLANADGTLVGLHNSYAELIIDMFNAVQSGDLTTALKLHRQQEYITEVLFAPPPMMYRSRYKFAAYLQGKVPNYRMKPPLPEVSEAEKKLIKEALLKCNLLEASDMGR
jgi:4-hydroxy-tetrahydrodipicolinate synthase